MNLINEGNIIQSIDESGYSLSCSLSNDELSIIANYINEQWLSHIKKASPLIAEYIVSKRLHIKNYHQISPKLDHSSLWSKKSRILNIDFVRWFQESSFFKNLTSEFGDLEVSDEEGLGFPNIYWRLVRPNQSNDIGPIHRDSWFWDLNDDFPKPSYSFRRIKVWIAIYSEPGLNGLLVEPRSHLRNDIKWSSEKRHGINKPILEMQEKDINPILVPSIPGQAIIFHDDLLHGGALNKGQTTRVSAEFTLLKRI